MYEFALPIGYALFLWWFSTGLIVYLDGLPRHTFRASMSGATVIMLIAIYGLVLTRNDATTNGALLSFTCGLLIWAWQEISYFMGYITGTRKIACEEGCHGWSHFKHAIQVNIYHELAIILGAILIVGLTWGATNQVGTWTYLLLWLMQLSAKLNVFLGVRNLSEEFLPEHMQYLKSFLKKDTINFLFPFSVTILTVFCMYLVYLALVAPVAYLLTAYSLLATIVALAILEHWLLVLPIPATALWNWWMSYRDSKKVITQDFNNDYFLVGNSSFPQQAIATAGTDHRMNFNNNKLRSDLIREAGSDEFYQKKK